MGQRRKKLQARQKRIEEEETQKQALDRIFASENEARRKEVVDKAKKLQYFGSDIVKNFHTRVMLLEVLQERDLQIALKKEKAKKSTTLETYYLQLAQQDMQKGIQEEQKMLEESKKRQVKLAKEQVKQHQEKVFAEQSERKVSFYSINHIYIY